MYCVECQLFYHLPQPQLKKDKQKIERILYSHVSCCTMMGLTNVTIRDIMVFQFNEALERIGSEIEKDQAEQVRNTHQ